MIRYMKIITIVVLFSSLCPGQEMDTGKAKSTLSSGSFKWIASPPVLEPVEIDGEKWLSVKDPSIVRYKGKWHLFCTVRGIKRSHAVIYLTFDKWGQAKTATQQVLKCHPGYFCAPHVFY
jgi:endo-1,4-beta-xylanase